MNKTFIEKWLFEMFLLVMGWVGILLCENPLVKMFEAVAWWSFAYVYIVFFMADEARKNSVILWGS